MFNTEMGEPCTANMLVECVQLFERDADGKACEAIDIQSYQGSNEQPSSPAYCGPSITSGDGKM